MVQHICDTTDQAEGAMPNGTRVQHVRRDRPGTVTGSQWSQGFLVYNVAWDDRRALPIFVEAEKLKPRDDKAVGAQNARIALLSERVKAAQQEFDLAVMFHEAWKPTAYDASVHERMGVSFATHTFNAVRAALRREMLLALTRLWDKPKKGLRMDLDIGKDVRDPLVIDALALERATRLGLPEAVEAMRKSLSVFADEALRLIDKYSPNGSHYAVREDLQALRNQHLAHRQVVKTTVEGASATDQQIEDFYQDNSRLIGQLMHLVEATAYDPNEAADVFAQYAAHFWAGVRGEQTEGHPNFRPHPHGASAA